MSEYSTIQEVISKHCQPNPTIFEFGAYDCYLTGSFYRFSPTKPKHYFVFEADSDNFKRILQAAENLPREIVAVNKAISNYTGKTPFYKSSGKLNNQGNEYDVCGSIRPPKELSTLMPFIKFNKIPEIECVSLDDFCKNNCIDKIDIILADIQGAEKNMIEGGEKMIPKTKFIYLEKCNNELYDGMLFGSQLKEFMQNKNFDIYMEFENDSMFINKDVL